jgi:putative hemolysin
MSKAFKVSFSVFLAVLLLLGGLNYAGTAQSFSGLQASLLPDNPFYFVKDIGREIRAALTFNASSRTELRISFAGEKLIEAKESAKTKDDASVIKALSGYDSQIAKASEASKMIKSGTQSLLDSLTLQIMESQDAFNDFSISGIAQQQVQDARQSSLDALTSIAFNVFSPDEIEKSLESAVNNTPDIKVSDKVDILDKVKDIAPAGGRKAAVAAENNIINKYVNDASLDAAEQYRLEQDAEDIKGTPEYQQAVLLSYANKIINDDQGLLSSLNLTSDDVLKLKNYSQNIINQKGMIDFSEAIAGFNSLNLSSEASKIIDELQSQVVNRITGQNINCTNIINLVCGKDGQTYNNICSAYKIGTAVSYYGKCGSCITEGKKISSGGTCCPGLALCSDTDTCSAACNNDANAASGTDSIVCNDLWQPVCGSNGNTYSNDCYLSRAGAAKAYDGECKKTSSTSSNKSGIANPASTFCKDQGYVSQIKTNGDGSQYGVCVFDNGKQCEEWSFYNGSCGSDYRRYLIAGRPYPQETVCMDSDYAITFKSSGIGAVKLSFLSSDGQSYPLKQLNIKDLKIADDGSKEYTWKAGTYVNGNILDPGSYTLVITSVPGADEKVLTAKGNDPFELSICK